MIEESLHQVIYLKNQRSENMDRYLVESRMVSGVLLRLYAVCDGVGSTPRGGEVAQAVVSGLWEWFDALETVEGIYESLCGQIAVINEDLLLKEKSECLPRGATTLSLLLVVGEEFFVFHLGDSRIYGREDEKWVQLTEDQVLMGALIQCIPMEKMVPLSWSGRMSYSHFFLATDGMYRKLDWVSVERELPLFGGNKQFLSDLAEEVIASGEKDNITGIFICNGYEKF